MVVIVVFVKNDKHFFQTVEAARVSDEVLHLHPVSSVVDCHFVLSVQLRTVRKRSQSLHTVDVHWFYVTNSVAQ